MPPHVGLAIAVGLSALVQLEAQPSAPADPIRKLRMGKLMIEAAPNTAVRVEQIRHEFSFGAALANQVFNGRLNAEDAAKYKQVFLENFNSAVTENALKWHDMEPQPGQVNYYRICFAHPAVEGILMWGFWEGANWIPVSSLYRRDWTPTPAAEAYRDLLFKEWWTRWEGRTDAQGRCEVPAFFGKHRVTASGKSVEVRLNKTEGTTRCAL
jgi:hypothetical protein